jgi:hypothetical protein
MRDTCICVNGCTESVTGVGVEFYTPIFGSWLDTALVMSLLRFAMPTCIPTYTYSFICSYTPVKFTRVLAIQSSILFKNITYIYIFSYLVMGGGGQLSIEFHSEYKEGEYKTNKPPNPYWYRHAIMITSYKPFRLIYHL